MADKLFGAIDDEEDFGAIDDNEVAPVIFGGEDIGAIDDFNPQEIGLRLEKDQKDKAAAAQLLQAQQQAQAAEDPKNWTLQETQRRFKEKPPKDLNEEAQQKLILDSKKKQLKDIQDQMTGEYVPPVEPSQNPKDWNLEQTKDYLNKNPARTIQEEAGQKVFLAKKQKEFKEEGTSAVAHFFRSFMRNSPLEQLKTSQFILENMDQMPAPLEGEKMDAYQKRAIEATGVGQREKEIEGKGTVHQFEDIMNVGIGGGMLSAPVQTAKLLAFFSGIRGVTDAMGVSDMIKKVPGATAKDMLDIVRFGVEGALAGGAAEGAGKGFKSFAEWRKAKGAKEITKTDLAVKHAEKPKAGAEVTKEPIVENQQSKPQPESIVEEVSKPKEAVQSPTGVPQSDLNQPVDRKAYDEIIGSELAKADADRVSRGTTKTPDEARAEEFVRNNPEQMEANYKERLKEEYNTDYDRIISADSAKFAIPGMDVTMSGPYHEPASAFSKYKFDQFLKDPATKDKPVFFSAGISGAGKTHSIKTQYINKDLLNEYSMVYDTNLNSLKSFETKYNQVKKMNAEKGFDRAMWIHFVYRDPIDAYLNGVIPRAIKTNRVVPIDAHISNATAPATIRAIAKKYPEVGIYVERSDGKSLRPITVDEIPKMNYTLGELKTQLVKSVEELHNAGKISDQLYRQALGKGPAESAGTGAALRKDSGTELPQGPVLWERGTDAGAAGSDVGRPTDNVIPAEEIPSDKRRKFIQTVKSSEKTAREVAEKVESRYNPLANEETLARAKEEIAADENAAIEELFGPAKPTAVSNVKAILLIDKAQNEGRYADAIRMVDRTAEKQTEIGQTIQALSLYNRLTPEGILLYANKAVREAREAMPPQRVKNFEDVSKSLKGADRDRMAKELGIPHISEIVAGELRKMAEMVRDMPEGREKTVQTALMLKKISDQIPKSTGKKLSMIQTIFQLLNPKTFVRNLLGNVGFQLGETITDPVAVALDIAASLRTGERTVYMPDMITQAKGLGQGFKEGVQEAVLGIDTKDSLSKFTLPKNGVFDKGVMGAFEKTLRVMLGATDRAFYQAAFNQSIRDQMISYKAKNKGAELKEPSEEMVERAHLLGLYRTFQDENVISRKFVELKRFFNDGKDFGMGDVVLKYPKTPANILARGIEYSPFGFLKTVYELAKPLMGHEFNQEAFSRSTARAMTGSTLLVGAGAMLASLGLISGKRSKDPDLSATREQVGLREYQMNISGLKRFIMSGFDPEQAALREGDTLVSYDWILPASIGLALGANMVIDPKTNLVDRTLNMVERMASATETLQEQPLVQGVKKFAQTRNVGEALTNMLQEIPASFIPTFLNQIRQLTDNTARNTKDPNYFKEAYNKAIMRIPGAAGTLPPKITPLGNEKEMYQFGSNNPFNVFLNPAFVNKYKPDPVSKMVLEIWEMSGETIQFPRIAQGKIKLGADSPEGVELTPEQYTEFQRYIGNKTDVLFTILADTPEFMALEDEDKAKKLQGFLTDINTAAKIEVLGYEPKRVSKDVLDIIGGIQDDLLELDTQDFGAKDE